MATLAGRRQKFELKSTRLRDGGRLVELRRDWAVTELAENGSQRIVDRRRLDALDSSGRPGSEPEAT
jgi:hypothetical protein